MSTHQKCGSHEAFSRLFERMTLTMTNHGDASLKTLNESYEPPVTYAFYRRLNYVEFKK